MKIRNKTLTILGIAFIVLFISLIATTEYVIGSSFDKLEMDEINKDMERVSFAFETELGFIEAVASDWAPWDDTYHFVKGEYDGYVDSNLDGETLGNMGLNMILFYDAADQPYYVMGADIESYEEMEVSDTLIEYITSQEVLFSHSTTDGSISGIMNSPEGPLLIASNPITQSSREGQIAGTFVAARYLDDYFIEMLEEKAVLDLDLVPFEPEESRSETDSSVLLASGAENTEIKFLSENSALGTILLKDINGKSILSLNANIPRDINQQSNMTREYLSIMIICLGLFFLMLVSLAVQKTVLTPISLLNTNLAAITKSGSLTSRLNITGDDELSGLAGNINYMLGSLEEKSTILETLDTLESSLESIDTGIMVVDRDSRIIMNSKFINMWDLSVDVLQQNDVMEILKYVVSSSESDDEENIEKLRNASGKENININLKNGSTFEWHAGPLLHNGNEIGAVYSVNDITDRIRVQLIEQENNQKMKTVLSNIISGVLVIDANTHEIIDSNPVSESIIGLPKEKIIGNTCHKFICPSEDGKCPITDNGLTHDRSEHMLIDESGNEIPILKSVVKADFSGREVLIESFVDLTKIKEAEKSLIEAKLAAESANRSKSDFLATMSHELRTPLNSIIGFSDLIIGGSVGDVSDMQKKFLGNISTSGKHLLSLINNVLDISKIEAGKMEIDFELFPLDETMTEVKQLIAPLANKKELNIEFHIDGRLTHIFADKIRFKQIMFNLVSNAIKFTPDGGKIDICANIEGNKALFVVKDTGIGISEENQSKLFQPFMQIDSATNRQYEGTGLGLSLVKKFLELHEGNIWLKSTPGKGTTFTFELPLKENTNLNEAEEMPEKVDTEQNETALSLPRITEPEMSTGNEPLIVVVEDDDASRELLEFTLVHEGYRVASVSSGKEALELAKIMEPFAITLDIMMPGMDGWDVLKHLKLEKGTQNIPVIITSMVDEKKTGIIWGATEYFIKPVEKRVLLNTMDRLKEKTSKPSLKVLVVDDEITMVDLISEMLKGKEFDILTAYGGQEAIDLALKENPDVIVLDLMMPEVSGFDVIHALKNKEQTIDIPIIICSAKDLQKNEKSELNDNVSYTLQKGMFNKESLIECIRNTRKNN